MSVLFWTVASLAFAPCISKQGRQKEPNWDGLTVKFGDPRSKDETLFNALPLTEDEAKTDGWVKITGDCTSSAKWQGIRYVKDDDYAIILLYDVRGNISGIQTSVPKNKTSGYPADFKPFVEDGHGDRLTVTAYFYNPKHICRKKKRVPRKALYLQRTSDPLKSVKVTGRRKLRNSPLWTEGKCFAMMGHHFWSFNPANPDNACFADDSFPAFVLHSGKHKGPVGFGWFFVMDLPSSRYEHPPKELFSSFIKDVPKCVAEAPTISTMHIYFTTKAAILNIGC